MGDAERLDRQDQAAGRALGVARPGRARRRAPSTSRRRVRSRRSASASRWRRRSVARRPRRRSPRRAARRLRARAAAVRPRPTRQPPGPFGGSTTRRPSSASWASVIRRRSTAHRVEARLVLRERDHVAQVRLAGEHHRHPVDPERDAAVRRRAHRERVEEEAELRALVVARSSRAGRRPCAWMSGSWIRNEPPPSSLPLTIRS